MRSIEFTSRPWTRMIISCALLFGLLVVGLRAPAAGQTSEGSARTTRFDDIVFAISFSPDGQTIAIARGAGEPARQFGRIELWDPETGKLRLIIKGFDGPVRSISFSPDGNTLISSSTEFRSAKLQQEARSREGESFAELKWWDSRTGELKRKLLLPAEGLGSIQAIQSPDGKLLALSEPSGQPFSFLRHSRFRPSSQRMVDLIFRESAWGNWSFYSVRMKLVDAQTGDLKYKLDKIRPGAVSFSPDGNLLAVANGNEVKLWNSQTGKEVRKLKNLRGSANNLAFSPSGQSLAVVSTSYERKHEKHTIKIIGHSEVKIFDVTTGKVTVTVKELGAVNTLLFAPDGRMLVMGGILPQNRGEAAGLKFLDLQTGKINDLETGADYTEGVDSLVLSGNGFWLAFRAGPATVKLIHTPSGKVKQTWDADSVGDAVERPTSRFLVSVNRVLAVAFSADGKSVSGENDQGEIKLWDQRTGEVKQRVSIEQDDPSLVAASSDGRSFAEVVREKLLFWDATSDTKKAVLLQDPQTPSALALSADGKMLALASGNKLTLVLPTGEVLKKLGGLEGSVTRLAFSNDGRWLAAADYDGTVWICDVASGRVEKTLETPNEVTALVFAPGGDTLATANDRNVSLWNLKTGGALATLKKHDSPINALAFSPNGQLLASGGDDRTIVLWEVGTGKSKRTFKGHDQTVTSLAFSPDGELLASGSGNASVVLWEVGTGKVNRVLR